MIDHWTRQDLLQLADRARPPAISLYLPTESAGPETEQNAIRFGNLLRRIEKDPVLQELPPKEREELLAPLRDLVGHRPFWQHQGRGLAVFRSREVGRSLRVGIRVPQLAMVGGRFYIKPLLKRLACDARFFLLALDKRETRLFEGDRFGLEAIDLGDTPTALHEILAWEAPTEDLQFHTRTPPSQRAAGRAGARAAVFHGQGGGASDTLEKEQIRVLFRAVDDAVRKAMGTQEIPLVLAGVEYEQALFREITHMASIVDRGIPGNPSQRDADELHEAAWRIIEPQVQRRLDDALDIYAMLKAAKRASADLEAIVQAAVNGRIDTLFVEESAQKWGTFDPASQRLVTHSTSQTGDLELLDEAAVWTLRNDGAVVVLPSERMPEDSVAAASFRYPG